MELYPHLYDVAHKISATDSAEFDLYYIVITISVIGI